MVYVGNCSNEPPSNRDTVIYGSFAVPFVDDHFSCCIYSMYACMYEARSVRHGKRWIFVLAHAVKACRGSRYLRHIDW